MPATAITNCATPASFVVGAGAAALLATPLDWRVKSSILLVGVEVWPETYSDEGWRSIGLACLMRAIVCSCVQ